MSTAITQYEGSSALAQWREPEEVLAHARKCAIALKGVLDLKPADKKVVFNNEEYLERDDWGTVANFYNCTAKSIETRPMHLGDVIGFEAVAVVIDKTTGVEIGRAESMCLSDEENWGKVPKYEWQDKTDENGKKIWNPNLRKGKGGYEATKVKIGEFQKPLFQLRSMAQTRAEAKALKSVFGWVVVLAGYRPTPAEELTGHEDFDGGQGRQSKPPVTQPTRASEKKTANQQTAQTTQAATQSATQGEQQQPAGDEVSGVIKEAVYGQNGIWKLTIGEKIVVVPADKTDADMVKGKFIKLRGSKRHSDKVGDYWALESLIELSDVQEGEPATEKKMDPETAALADELFGDKPAAGKEAVQGMIDKGELKPASQVTTTTKPGTIGTKRAKRLYAIAGQNKKTTGFTEENIHKVLAALPTPLEHLSDLEVSMYETFEKLCTGEEKWEEYLPE